MKKLLLLLSFMVCCNFLVSAEHLTGCEADNLANGASRIWLNPDNGTIKFVELTEPTQVQPDRMEAWLKNLLKTNDQTGFTLYETITDKLGFVHFRFRQTHNGHTVNNGVYYIHTSQGKIVSANGEFYPDIDVDANPIITIEGAIGIGKEYIHGHQWAWPEDQFPTPELRIDLGKDGYHLTYKTDIYSIEPLNRRFLMIDVVSGEVIAEYDRIHHNSVPGEVHCKYHGVQTAIVDSISPTEYRLRDDTRGGGVETYDMNEGSDYGSAVDFTDSDNVWTSTTNQDDAALDAHWGTESMYDYMLGTHGYESYDGNGATMLSYVHYGTSFANAFWDGERMTYGDGDGVDWQPLTSTEVVGHEVMHGVTENTAGLIYSGESGALNESYSDCFGTILDFQINPMTANYRMGDDFMLISLGLRNMGDPNEFSNPDTYLGDFWNSGGVHNQSGVQNFWFYLLTQGGSGTNDNNDAYLVNPIPMADVADILFRSLSVYLTPSSPYADARFYGVQSATELFGDCTDQVIGVTNAWHAVGVGDLFNDAVQSAFISSSNFSCQAPASIQFTNNSINGSTFVWDFGNGTTSTSTNPVAIYDTPGTYTVSLIANGSALCGNSDTTVLVDFVTVTNVGGPTTPSCFPSTSIPAINNGIFNFTLETINNSTLGSEEGYQDYSCTASTDVTEGVLYPFSVQTGANENIRIWVDVDNDGVFNNTNEFVYASSIPSNSHNALLVIPDTDIYGEPLRLRIKSDVAGNDISDPCANVLFGQVEDYAIIVSENVNPPTADFVADQTNVLVGTAVNFTDLTQNLPENWSWEFPGGVPATSTMQNPTVVYSTLGSYPVTLTATNSIGQDVEMKTSYINVVSTINMCSEPMTTAPSGLYYDSGGEFGNYANNEFCTFLIDPGCALELTMVFSEFELESGFDDLAIYDGVDASAPLIGFYTGTNSPGTITATSGKMFFVFDTDGSVTRPGWVAEWTSLSSSTFPTADFVASDLNPPLNVPVDFTDLSTEYPSNWVWNFDDGNVSSLQNPSHTFTTPGAHNVEMIVGNCFDFDTVSYTIIVQDPSGFDIDPTSIYEVVDCGDSTEVVLTITNTGLGDLVYSTNVQQGDPVSETSMLFYDDFNNFTTHTFTDLASSTDSIFLEITINGDFDDITEFASLYIDGVYLFDIEDFGPTNGTDIIVNYAFGGAEVSSWLSDGVVEVYLENSPNVDDNQGGTNSHTVTLQTNGASWLTGDPLDGVIPESSSGTFTVYLNSTDLAAGIYTDEIVFTTNDAANPTVTIPVTMEVVGDASITFSETCLDFPEIMQYTTATLDVVVENDGCDTLMISDIFPDDSEYSASSTQLSILPHESAMITVSFTPTTVGSFPSNMNFVSNIPTALLCLTGTSFGAPAIEVDPNSISINMSSCTDELIVPITVTNTAFDDLIFSFDGSGSISGNDLESVRIRLNDDFAMLTDLMPNFYSFTNGETGSSIGDGGGDMYDTGNFLSVDNNFALQYSNDVIIPEADMGVGGQYFTRKYPGLFVFAADINQVDLFSIDGNLGADGAGSVSGAELNISHAGVNYKGFVKRVHNSNDPSINHLIIMRDNGNLVQTIPTGTGFDDHDVQGMNGLNRMYYLLFAEANSGLYSNSQMEEIMTKFLEIVETDQFITLPDGTFELAGGSSQTFDLVFNTSNTEGGVYNSVIIINSNDPLIPNLEIPVTINVNFDLCADYNYNQPIVCGGQVDFSSSVVNTPSSYLWDFGDGNTSSQANPTHLYSAPGNYTVTLTVENATSTSTVDYVVTITEVAAPQSACEVGSNDQTPTFDIVGFELNTIDNPNLGNSNGYTDYTCEWSTNLIMGVPYDLTIEGYDFDVENVRVWIDLNNNGSFDATELVYEVENEMSPHDGEITIPSSASTALGVPLRMRVACDAAFNNTPSPCTDLGTGEFEDYTVFIESNTAPPMASCNFDFIDNCQGAVQFNDLSTNLPTSWTWDFGDGSAPSNLQNPIHIYPSAGIYIVTLTVTNDFGTNSFNMTVTVNSLNPLIQYVGVPEPNTTITFQPNAPGAISWSWNFGDGGVSADEFPTHQYTDIGTYIVSLTVQNADGCMANTNEQITIVITGIEELEGSISLFPNPTNGNISIKNTSAERYYEIEVVNALGQVLKRIDTSSHVGDTYYLQLENYPPGMYVLGLKFADNQILQRKFVLQAEE